MSMDKNKLTAEDFEAMPTLGDIARFHAKARPDSIALTFEGRDTSFKQFDLNTNQVANELTASGVKKGQRIAYIGKNSDHYFELFFGASKVGVVMVPIGWRLEVRTPSRRVHWPGVCITTISRSPSGVPTAVSRVDSARLFD